MVSDSFSVIDGMSESGFGCCLGNRVAEPLRMKHVVSKLGEVETEDVYTVFVILYNDYNNHLLHWPKHFYFPNQLCQLIPHKTNTLHILKVNLLAFDLDDGF